MESRFINTTFVNEQEDYENSPENSGDSPRSSMLGDGKMTSISSPKRRRSIQKRVISVPIKDVEGSRLKGEMGAPPSDSWAWRKYGQKPIKGSPYPRGYYRCSSSKGCPARKQVERSKLDPNMLMVTYSCEHNHPWPAPRNNHHNQNNTTTTSTNTTTTKNVRNTNSEEEEEEEEEDQKQPANLASQPELNSDEKFGNLAGVGGEGSLISSANEYGPWFSEFEYTSSTMLESPILTEERVTDADMAMAFTMRDDDESFFADLGELPECSTVFRRGMMEREEERRRHSLTNWCGTTG